VFEGGLISLWANVLGRGLEVLGADGGSPEQNYMRPRLCVRGQLNTCFEEGWKSGAEADDASLRLHKLIF